MGCSWDAIEDDRNEYVALCKKYKEPIKDWRDDYYSHFYWLRSKEKGNDEPFDVYELKAKVTRAEEEVERKIKHLRELKGKLKTLLNSYYGTYDNKRQFNGLH